MAQRELARLVQAGAVQSVNWITQATETFDRDNPAENPENWGTEAEIAFLDRRFTAEGNEVTHLGLLATFLNKPDRSFYGAQVKIRPTYTGLANPFLEMWTLVGATWTLRRRVNIRAIARSGDTVIQELILDTGLRGADRPDAIWITLDTAVDVSLTWLVCHLYGDCVADPVTADCPPGTDPEDCGTPECSADPTDWVCAPIPIPPDLPPIDPFPFPPILINVLMPTTYTQDEDGQFMHDCPGPTGIRMYFGAIPGGGSVQVVLVDAAGLVFAEGVTQTISAPGTMEWTISAGYKPGDPNVGSGSAFGYLPPREVTDHVTFSFTRIAASPFTLLDILTYFWTYDLVYDELCYTDGPPVDGLPPAQDPPDDAGQTDYQAVYERWIVYADTQDAADEARAAATIRQSRYLEVAGGVLDYGLRPEDGARLRDALALTAPYLNEVVYDPGTCNSANYTNIPLDFQELVDGHVLTLRAFLVPVGALFNRRVTYKGNLIPQTTLNPFATASKVLPYNPTPNVQNIVCSPGTDPNDTQSGDLNQRLRTETAGVGASQQVIKYAGTAIQAGAYHLERVADVIGASDMLRIRPQPVPANPFAITWTPPCTSPLLGRCYQWWRGGYAMLLTIRIYEPVATPLGGTPHVDPENVNPTPSSGRLQLSSPDNLDATWP